MSRLSSTTTNPAACRPAPARAEKLAHAAAAEKHARFADIRLVGQRRRVERKEHDIVASRLQLGRQRVVSQAAAAVHPRRACRNKEDLHMLLALCNARGRYRK